MANIQDLINQARQNAQAKAEQIKQQNQQNNQSQEELAIQAGRDAAKNIVNRRNERLRGEFGFDTLEQDAGNQEQKLKRLYDNYRNGNYISDREFEDVLNSNKDMESRLGKYKDYLSLNKQDTSSVDGTIKNYQEIARELNSLRSYMSQFSNPEEYTTNWDNVTYGEKYKGMGLSDIDKAIGSTTGREQAWLTNHRYDYATSDDIQRELDVLNGENFSESETGKTLSKLYPFLTPLMKATEKLGIDDAVQKATDSAQNLIGLDNAAAERAKLRTQMEATRDVKRRTETARSYEDLANGKQSKADTYNPLTIDPEYLILKKQLDKPTYSKKYGDMFGMFEEMERIESLAESKTKEGISKGVDAVADTADKVKNSVLAKLYPFLGWIDIDTESAKNLADVVSKIPGSATEYGSKLYSRYKRMTPDEKRILQSLKDNYGTQAAVNYFSSLAVELDRRKEEETQQNIQKFSENLPGLANNYFNGLSGTASILTNVFSGVLAAGNDLYDAVVGNDFNPYNQGHRIYSTGQYLRSQVADNLAKQFPLELGEGHNLASEIYQGIMSGADSTVGAITLGSAYLATMGLGAAESKAKEAYEEGRSNEAIFKTAVAAGLAEILTEKMGYERLTKWISEPKTLKQIGKGILKQIIPEAAEEITSDIINDVTDAFVNAGDTSFDRDIKKIMEEQGVDEETARAVALNNKVADYIWSGVGGAVASLGGAGVGAVQSARAKSIGQSVVRNGLLNDLMDTVKKMKASDILVGDINFESAEAKAKRQNDSFKDLQDARAKVEDALKNGENPDFGDVGILAQMAGYAPRADSYARAATIGRAELGSYSNRAKRKVINDVGSMANLSNRQFKAEIKKKDFKNRFTQVFGVDLDSDNLSLVDKMNIVKEASKNVAELNESGLVESVRERLEKNPTAQESESIIKEIREQVINPIANQQKGMDKHPLEFKMLDTKRRLYATLCNDIASRGGSGATVFFEKNGIDRRITAGDVKALPGYKELSEKTRAKVDAILENGKQDEIEKLNQALKKTKNKKDTAAIKGMQAELSAQKELKKERQEYSKESLSYELNKRYGKSVEQIAKDSIALKKYGITVKESRKGEKDTWTVTNSDGSEIEYENRAKAEAAIGVITLFDDIDAGKVQAINYITGDVIAGSADFIMGHESAHLAVAADVEFIGRTIDSFKGTNLDIYGLADADITFSNGEYDLDVSKLNDRGQWFFEQMKNNLKANRQNPSNHAVLEEIVCDMYGSIAATDSFTRMVAEGSALGNLVRRAVDRFSKTRLGQKILRRGKSADNVKRTQEQAEAWLKKFDAIRERAEKFAPKRSDNDTQKTSSTIEALLSDLKRDGVKTDLSALDEKYLKRLISAEDKVAEAQKILAELGEDAGAARPALENLIKEKPRTGSTESRLDEQMNAIVENAPKQRRKNKAVEEARTVDELQKNAVAAFEEAAKLDSDPIDTTSTPVDTGKMQEALGSDPEEIVTTQHSMSTMFNGCGFDIPATDWDEKTGELINTPLTITYKGKAVPIDDMTGEFIWNTDSPIKTLLKTSMKKNLISKDEAKRLCNGFADILQTAMKFGNAGGGISAVDSIWRWASKSKVFSPIKKNSDDQYSRSIDFTTICKKTEELLGVVSQYQVKGKHGMTPGEVMQAYFDTGSSYIVHEDGSREYFQTPCPLCYVFAHWIDNGKIQQTQYTAQQYYGDTKKSGLKYRALTGNELDELSEEERREYREVWLNEYIKQRDFAEANEAAITDAKEYTKTIMLRVDDLTAQRWRLERKADRGTQTDEDRANIKKINDTVDALNQQYIAAANLLAYSDFAGWIKSNVLDIKTGESENDTEEDKKKKSKEITSAEIRTDYKVVPDDLIFDYFRIAECYEGEYNGYLRFRGSKGSDAGKGIETESDNAFGAILAGLSTGDPEKTASTNNALLAVHEKGISDEEREKREIAFEKQFDAARKNARKQSLIGGQRFFSWSDNRLEYGPDMFSAFVQLQALGCSVQSYTKQLEGLNLISQMGGYVNGSLIALGMGYKGSFNEGTGTLQFSDKQGINHKETFKLNKLNDKAGNILVGMNDDHILIALASDEIFFVIPYHKSGLRSEFLMRMMDMMKESYVDANGVAINDSATDYTDVQGEYVPGGEKGSLSKFSGGKVKEHLYQFWTEIQEALDSKETRKALFGDTKVDERKFDFLNKNRISHNTDGTLSDEQIEYRKLRARIILNDMVDGDEEKAKADPFLRQVYEKVHGADGKDVIEMTAKECDGIYPYEYWDESTTYKTADINGLRYLEYCRRLGVQPKFCGLNHGVQVKFKEAVPTGAVYKSGKKAGQPVTKLTDVYHPEYRNFAIRDGEFVKGYWKTLIDRRMYRNVYGENGEWLSYDGEYQGTDSVNPSRLDADGYEDKTAPSILDLILPDRINERFKPTLAASKETFGLIADKTRENLAKRGMTPEKLYIETDSQEKALNKYLETPKADMKEVESYLSDLKNSISTDTDGNKYVIVDENAIDVTDGRSVAANIAKILKNNFNNLITVNKQMIAVNSKTNNEFRRSRWAQALYNANRQWYDDKLKSIANADEVLKVAKEWVNEDIKHQRKDSIVSFGRARNVLYKVGNNGYEADVLVGVRSDGSAILYDIIGVKGKKITDAGYRMSGSNPSPSALASVTNNYTTNSSESQEANAKKSPADNYQPLTEEQTEWGRLNDENKEVGSPLYNMSGNLQGRWKNSVGKEAGGIYVHKDYAREVAAKLFGNLDALRKAEQIAKEKGIDYTCVMLDKSKPNIVRFDESPNFDTADEPIPGNTYTVNVTDGSVKEGFSDRIWHHKWMWVKNDYKGFDVEDSWNRSKEYLNKIRKLDAPKGSLEYEMSHNGTANGSARGYAKWNDQLDYFGVGRGKNSMSVEDERYLEDMYGLDDFKLAVPTSGWKQTLLKSEAEKIMPDLWKKTEQKVSNDEKADRDPTQRPITVSSYRNVFSKLKEEGFNGAILDASSGLGLGTKAGREEPFNFDVDDVELYPEESYNPRYRSYADIKKKYDVIISNAVLNVLPQDYRDALVTKMGQLLNDGGRMFINVRSTDVNNVNKDRNINTGENEWLIPKDGSYQKGFLKSELVAYLKDALGEGFTVEPFNKFGSGTWALVTKNSDTEDEYIKHSSSTDEYMKLAQNPVKNEAKLEKMVLDYGADKGYAQKLFHGTPGFGFTEIDFTFSDDGFSFWTTDNVETASTYSGRDDTTNISETPSLRDLDFAQLAVIARGIFGPPDDIYVPCGYRVSYSDYYWYANQAIWPTLASSFSYHPERYFEGISQKDAGALESEFEIDEGDINDKIVEKFLKIIKKYKPTNARAEYEIQQAIRQAEAYLGIEYGDGKGYVVMDGGYIMTQDELIEGLEENETRLPGNYRLLGRTEDFYKVDAGDHNWNRIPTPPEMKADIDTKTVFTRDISKWARRNGYRGAAIYNVYDHGGRGASDAYGNVFIFFNPEDIKSADPVTYDDNGNVIPLDQRFRDVNELRYSSSVDSEGRKLTEEQEEYFADSKIRDERGRLIPVYHGTKAAGFTRFRRQFRRGRSGALFFTDSPDIAAGYAELDPDKNRIVHPSLGWVSGGKGVFKFYLNVTNPLVKDFSEEPRAWDALYEGNPDLYFTSVFITDQDGDRYNVDFYFDSQEKKYDKFEPGWYTREQLNKLIGEKNAADLVNYDEIRGLALDKDKNRLLSTTDDWAEYAEANGYDGVVFKGIIDDASGFAEPSNVYAAFESKQAKDTRNTEPSDSGDFRYSSSVELLNPDSDEIRNISRMVDEARDRLKKASQRTPTGETASTSEYIRNVITNVIDNTQTGMTYDQIRDRLAEIYRYVYFKSEKKNGKFSTVPFSINTAWENLYSLANDIVNSAFEPAFTEDETAMFKDIYKRIRANALFKPAPGKHFAKATGVSIEDLIRNSPQKAKDSLNELYESLARDYPGLFPIKAEDIFDRYNQLRETAKQMNDSAKAKVQWAENHQTELEGIVTATALQLAGAIDKSYDEKALPRFAKKLNTLINRYEDDIEKLRDRILSIISNDRRKDDRAKAFRRLAIAARTLGRPTRARHFNENLKPIAKTLLESVVPKLPHRTKGETELYNTLNSLVKYAKTTDVNDYKDEFTQPIDDLKDAVDRFVQASKQYNSFDELSDQMYSDLSKLLYRLAHLSNVMNKSLYFDKGYRELSTQAAAEIRATRKAVTNSAPQKVIQWLESAALDPVSGFNVIGSDTLMECFKNIVRGQNDFTKTLNGWIIQMKDIVGDKVKPDWHNQADEYTFSQGKLKLTKGELMYLYLLAQQEDSWNCLTGSGAKPVVNDNLVERLGKGASSLAKDTVGEVKNKLSAFSKAKENVKYEMKKNFGKTIAHQNPVRFSEGDKMRIRSYLGTEAAEMCDRISLLLNGDVAKAGNVVSRKMEGYEKFNIAHYVPMIVDRNGNYEESTKNLGVYLAQPGFTKERDGRSKVLVLDDLFNVVEKHLLGMAQYSAFNEATADLVRIYANKYKGGSVAGVVNESFANGSPAKKFMENFITDIQGQQMNANIEPLAIERYLARYKKAAVAANLSTVAKQPTAIMRAFPEFSMKAIRKMHIGKGLIKSITDRDIAEMCEHSGLAMMKSWGFSENASPKSLRQLYDVNEEKRFGNLFNNAVSWGAEKADMITWAAIWRAAKFDTMKDGKEDLEAAAEKFNDVIVKTQVVNTATTTTRIAYQEGLAKLYFAFKNEPLKTFNYMRTALVNFARNKDAASFGKMLKVMVCAGLNSSVTAFITAAFLMLRDEEDDTDELVAKFVEKWNAATLDDLIENVTIFAADAYQACKDGFSTFTSTNIATAGLTDTVKALNAWVKEMYKPQNEKTKTWYNNVYNLAKGLSELSGIPIRTFMRSVKSISYATANISGDPYLKYLVTKTYYNAEGYDSADAKTQFKAILTDALNHQDWEGYAKVKKKLQYHGYSSTDFDAAIKASDVFVNAYNEGNLSKILKEARKYDDSLTEEKILKLIKSTNTSEITNLFNEMKAHGESSEYRKLKKELLGKKNPETGKNYTEKEIEKLIEKKVESALKSDLSKRLAGILQTDPLWTEIVRKLAREYSRLGVTEDDVKKIARGL